MTQYIYNKVWLKVRGLVPLCLLVLSLFSCRTDDIIVYIEDEDTGVEATIGDIVGMYVLCEGNMGSNKCTLDYLDLSGQDATIHYLRNIYAERNPNEVKELGDVGNDIKVYGSQLWMVINCSNKVEVCRAADCRKLAKIDIPNCRSLAFHKGYAYVSSYVGPVGIDNNAPLGQVYKIDTLTHQIAGIVTVGYQPDELTVVGNRLYVANSGGYLAPDYDHTVSVINLTSFQEEQKIDVAPNLHRIRTDRYGQLWVTSRGNYSDKPGCLLWLSPDHEGNIQPAGKMDINVTDMCIVGDSLYYISSESKSYGIVNVRTHAVVTQQLSDAQELAKVKMPYGIIVNPIDRDFYVMDAKNYVSSGELLHFLKDGSFDYKVKTGDIPGHATFLTKMKTENK